MEANKQELVLLRNEIERIDSLLVPLYEARLECSKKVKALKDDMGLPVYDKAREAELRLVWTSLLKDSANEAEAMMLLDYILNASKRVQNGS